MHARGMRALLPIALVAITTGTAWAQYFGQNKVRFKSMDFEVLETDHFDIHYYPEEREATVMAGRMAERWYQRFSTILNHDLPPHQPIIFYDASPAFRQTTVLDGGISVGTGGVTEGLKRRVIMPFAGPTADTDHVLGHELIHAFQYDMTSGPGNAAAGGVPGAATLPLWFIEGMAEYLSVGPVDPNTAMWLRDAVARNALPNWNQLDDPAYFPYRFGQAFWAYLGGTYGESITGKLLLEAGQRRSVGAAIVHVLGMQPEAVIERWHTALRNAYEPVLSQTEPPSEQARTVVAANDDNSLNVSPVISPDGTQAVLFSAHDLFSIELFLVDVATGEIKKKLTSTASSPHLDSLEFIQSAGAWSPDGTRFVYPTLRTGRPTLAIYDFREGKVTHEAEFRQLGDILTPTWSPDGARIAFSAIAGGLLDLYIYDIQSEQLTRATNDAFAEVHPAWSPSGRYIAFSTDRFTSDLDLLRAGQMRLGLLDVTNNQTTPVAGLPEGKHINPNWGADDNTLYFVSDFDGIPNIYRMQRDTGSATQLTSLRTGASGIGPLSPALSVAQQTGTVLFSSFSDGMYSVYALPATAPQRRGTQMSYTRVATLPPLELTQNALAESARVPRASLPQAAAFTTTDYSPSLSLDYIAPPTISAGTSSFGNFVGGGTALYFSDMLQQHQLMLSLQSIATNTGSIGRNINITGGYQNQKSRWTWGLIGGQSPYISGGYSTTAINIEGQPVIVEQQSTIYQIERQATGVLAYPFSRAMRMELTGGYRGIGFAGDVQSDFYTVDGQFLGSQTDDLDAPSGLHMAASSAALVYDTSINPGLSPIMGRSFRFEAGTQAGSINFSTALADFRQYFHMPGNLTFAVRGMHYGRYGGGAEDPRQQDLFIGFPALIRGYTTGSFSAAECGADLETNGSCPAFDQLLGSRMAVANAELRIPLIGAVGLIPSRGYPPVEFAPFFDAAYAWRSTERSPAFLARGREPVRSYGGTLRANVLGYFIAQMSYVRPMDRPKGWHWEFAIVQGF